MHCTWSRNLKSLVGLGAVRHQAILVAVDGDSAHRKVVAGAEDTNGDFTAVAAEHLLGK